MIELNVGFWQTPLFIFLLTVVAGLAGFFLRYYIDLKRAKRLKIRFIEFSIGMKYVGGGYVTPTLNIKLENLSRANIKIIYARIKSKERLSMASIEMIPTHDDRKEIDILELKSFKFYCARRIVTTDPKTKKIVNTSIEKLKSPTEVFHFIFHHMNAKTKPIKSRQDFKKRIKKLGVFIHTNIGNYYRKFSKKERKMFFERTLLEEFDKAFPNDIQR